MAFPQVAATNNGAEGIATVTHPISMPAGIIAGDLLIIYFVTGRSRIVTDWDGFSEIRAMSNVSVSLYVGYKIAVGSDTCTLKTNFAEQSAHITHRITGWNSKQIPEVSTGVYSSNVNPDPDSLTPVGGAKDYLWIAVSGSDDGRDLVTGYPADYDDNQEAHQSAESEPGVNIGVATRELNASSEDPGAFTIESNEQWNALTVAVSPPFPPLLSPKVAATNNGRETSGTLTHSISMPAGINAGDLLLIYFATDNNCYVSDWDGFVALGSAQGSAVALHVGYKIAVGGDTCTLTIGTYRRSVHITHRITGFSGTPEASAGVYGANVNPNPDLLTPVDGAKDYLWIAIEANDDPADGILAYPTNYDNNQDAQQVISGNYGCWIALATREFNAAFQDPDTFTIEAIEQWGALTVVIPPAPKGKITPWLTSSKLAGVPEINGAKDIPPSAVSSAKKAGEPAVEKIDQPLKPSIKDIEGPF